MRVTAKSKCAPKISPMKYHQEILQFHATLTELLQSLSYQTLASI